SGQLQAEAYALAFGDVYTFGPTFRAENSNTARHAAEFWMVEPEIAFADLKDNMALAEDMVREVIAEVMAKAPDELNFLNSFVDKELLARLTLVRESAFTRISYTEAVDILNASGQAFEYPVSWGMDLQTEHERYLTEKHFKRPVFVTDYPKDIKAFYMRMNEDDRTVAAVDLLVPGIGELIGGSQREERYDRLLERITQMGLEAGEYSWYLDLRRFGSVKHAGFGLGFERFVMYLTGMTNIRDVLPFPRTVGNAAF
ncbi:MAG: asparagine--tRNA ligase, partial [Eubacteriales bacterium]|nr:asparagine--tRNA ligase [Eubacteriales bacterium]